MLGFENWNHFKSSGTGQQEIFFKIEAYFLDNLLHTAQSSSVVE
jgi:hypothetical protein